MLKKAVITIIITLISSVTVQAQSVANYSSVRNTGVAYSSVNLLGLPFSSWRNTGAYSQDDNRSDFTDIGFDFWYNGTRYTQFCVSTNGFIDFSSSTDNGDGIADDFGYDNNAFTGNGVANTTNPAIAPFYDDLMAQGGTAALGNSVKYYLSGAAPNRTLTVEWINMAVYGNTTPSLNFQVKLVEKTGVILVHYGTMNSGTFGFTYSMGMNAQTMNNAPSAAQLKALQTVNSNSFNNNQQNNLSVMPAANSVYIFTPPVPTPTAGSLAFSAVSQSSMTLNWTNWASNEVGYVIYNSTDGVNYDFVTQTAANATSASVTGLQPSTTYFWKLYAVTEGCLSAAISGTQATNSGGNKISVASGNWGLATTWSPVGVPTAGENVTIASNHTVSININAACNNLTIGSTGAAAKLQYAGTTKTLTVNGNINVTAGAAFDVNTASNNTHVLIANGNFVNSGIVEFSLNTDLCNVIFQKNGSHSVSGTGSKTAFNKITINKGISTANVLEVTSSNFTAPVDFLTLTNGTFKLSNANTVTLTPFSNAITLSQSTGLWLNASNVTLNAGNTITLTGKITVSNGTLNIGNAANEDLLSSGGTINLSNGAVNIAGKYYSTGINNLSFLSVSGGTLTVPTISSTSTTDAPFQISGVGSVFNMSNGLIIIPREGGSGAQDFGYNTSGASSGAVTGGTVQIGNGTSPASQTICINSGSSIGNLLVNSANVTAKLLANNVNVINQVAIATGTLHANNLNITLGGNWANNGGIFVPGTASVTLNSTAAAQTIFKSGGETFNNLVFSGAGPKSLLSAITATNITINSGSNLDVNTTSNQITLKRNFFNNGTFNARKGLLLLNGTSAQTIGGTTTTDFYDLTLTNSSGASISNNENLINALTLNSGTFNTNGKVFTMVSTANNTARIAPIAAGADIVGNVNVQRYAPPGYTGWALIGTPISSALTLQDWDDDIPISCPSCPDGSAAGFLSIYTYDETKLGLYDEPTAYIPLSGITDPITPNKGYWVYLGTNLVTTNPITLDVVGTVRKFNNSIPLTRTSTGSPADDGWNLIHNPYPSPIKWTSLRNGNTNVDNAIYVYNTDLNGGLGGYATYVNGISSPAIGAGGISDTIPMCQGFYVHALANTTLNGTESVKVSGNPAFLKMTTTAQVVSAVPTLRIKISEASGMNDETVLYMQSGANRYFEMEYDALKIRGQDPSAPCIALQDTANEFQVNGIAPITSNFSIPLKVTTGYTGLYTISLANFNSFPTGACIQLFDRYNNTTTDLKLNNYVFTLSDTTVLARFDLNITLNPLNINSNLSQPTCALPSAGKIVVEGTNAGPWNYYWKNANNVTIKTSLNKTTADTLDNLSGGDYYVDVNTVGMCDNNQTDFTVNTIELSSSIFTNPDTVDLANGGLIIFANNSTGASVFNWNFGDGIGFSSDANPAYNYLSEGTYTISLDAESSSGCTSSSTGTVVVVNTVSGIEEASLANNWLVKTISSKIYQIDGVLESEQQVFIQLKDALGKLIRDFGTIKTNHLNLDVDLSAYNSGVYFLTINTEDAQKVIKLIAN